MLTVIGDVHGQTSKYIDLTEDSCFSVQIGDMGFNYQPLLEWDVDPEVHKFFFGNHDICSAKLPHVLGDFGEYTLGGVKFFFVRGAFSIDKEYRLGCGWHWDPEEELSSSRLQEAIDLYTELKPDIMLTHDCPRQIANIIGNPSFLWGFGFDPERFTTRTSEALQTMFEAHQPRQWIFGHFHKSWNDVINGTHFRCLNELETYTIETEDDE